MRLNDCGNQAKEPYLSLPLLAEQAATSLLLLSEVLIEHCLHIPLSQHPARSYSCPGRWATCKTGCARAAIDGRNIRLDKATPALHVTWSAGRVARATRQKATAPVSL